MRLKGYLPKSLFRAAELGSVLRFMRMGRTESGDDGSRLLVSIAAMPRFAAETRVKSLQG